MDWTADSEEQGAGPWNRTTNNKFSGRFFFLLQSPNPPFQRFLHINFHQEPMGYGLLLLLNYR